MGGALPVLSGVDVKFMKVCSIILFIVMTLALKVLVLLTIKSKSNTLPVVFSRSLAMKPSGILRVLGLGAFFCLVNYLLPMVGI